MITKELDHLSYDTVTEIRRLEAVCKRQDGLRGDLYLDKSLNYNTDIKTVFLMYDDSRLTSVLSVFVPTRREGEIQGYTLPDYRRKGCFKTLLDKAVEELQRFEVDDLLLVCESNSSAGRATAVKLGARHEFSEHFMRLSPDAADESEYTPGMIELSRPKPEDLAELIRVSVKIFADSYEEAHGLISRTLGSGTREQFAALLHGEIVGLGAVSYEGDETAIFGFGIVPEHRGRGIGADFLRSILKHLSQRGRTNITLEVDAGNTAAFNLYRRCGFTVETTFDYYRKRVPAYLDSPPVS